MELNWFKINADFYNDSRVVYVETQKNGAVILHHYLKLQCMAARSNRQGGIFIAEKLSHNAKTLANEWHLKADTVKKSLEILEEAGLIEIIDGVIFIADWDRVQSADKLEQIRKSNREQKRKWREKKKAMSGGQSGGQSADCPAADKEIEKEIEKDLEEDEDIIGEAVAAFNTATAFPKIKILSKAQKELVLNAVKEFGAEQLYHCFDMAGRSEFLNGKNSKGWVANFDWLIKPESIAKVLNGNYNALYAADGDGDGNMIPSSFNDDEFIQAALKRGFDDL